MAQTPRIRIVHLFLWMALCAVFLAIRTTAQRMLESIEPDHTPIELVGEGLRALVDGTTLTGILILVRECFRGNRQMLRHPGHWLLLAITPVALVDGPCWLFILSREDPYAAISASGFCWCVLHFAAFAVLAFAAVVIEGKRWKLPLAALAAGHAIQGLQELMYLLDFRYAELSSHLFNLGNLTLLVAYVAVGVVSVVEWVQGDRRDWLHWIGMAVCAASLAIALLPAT